MHLCLIKIIALESVFQRPFFLWFWLNFFVFGNYWQFKEMLLIFFIDGQKIAKRLTRSVNNVSGVLRDSVKKYNSISASLNTSCIDFHEACKLESPIYKDRDNSYQVILCITIDSFNAEYTRLLCFLLLVVKLIFAWINWFRCCGHFFSARDSVERIFLVFETKSRCAVLLNIFLYKCNRHVDHSSFCWKGINPDL